MPKGILKICKQGHRYYKRSDCPTCPICEKARKPAAGFLSLLPAPARRALETSGITSLNAIRRYSETEILDLHGMGPSALKKLKEVLQVSGLSFREEREEA